MNNLRKFTTEAEYTAATLNYPSVSWVTSTDVVHFDKESPAPATFSGLTVYYNISDISQPTQLFKGGGSGSGSGSGAGGVLPSSMIIDGTEVEVTSAYAFDTVGEHIVQYSFAENQVPGHFLDGEGSTTFSTVTKVEIGDTLTSIGDYAFIWCSFTNVTIGNGVTRIGDEAFNSCTSLISITIPDSVTSIGAGAFYECTALESCTIGSGVTSIGDGAFASCNGLASIESNVMTAPTLGSNVFSGISYNGVLTVPSGSQGYCAWIGPDLPGYWTIEGVTCE